MRAHHLHTLAAVGAMFLAAFASHASVQQFANDKQGWLNAVPAYSNITFQGFLPPPNPTTFITNQYALLGITFTDGNDSIFFTDAFLNDGVGLDGNGGITVTFAADQYWVAADFPGLLQIKLYNDGVLAYTSSVFSAPFVGGFAGLISTTPFDKAVILDPAGEAEIDDLYFGPPIPTPGALVLLGLAALMPAFRRRRPVPRQAGG